MDLQRSEGPYIYVLIDPRDERIRYVGCTRDPESRFRSHSTPAWSKKLMEWRADLREEGFGPIFWVIDTANVPPDYDMRRKVPKESEWIQRLARYGCDLLNVRDNPNRKPYTQ